MPRVLNKHKDGYPKDAIYIGRPSLWGNPFEIGRDGDRDTVVMKHDTWLETGESFGCAQATEEKRKMVLLHIKSLKGKDVVCFCSPHKCHGDNLIRRANP